MKFLFSKNLHVHFVQVIIKEVDALQKACIELDPGYQPGITFLVVQKRHHTRLFPKNRQDEVTLTLKYKLSIITMTA